MIRSIYVPAAVRGNLVNASPISFGVVDPRCEMGDQNHTDETLLPVEFL